MPPPDMTPRIDPVAYLKDATGMTIEAYGPINWAPATGPPEEIAAWFTVVISQVIEVPAAAPALPSYEMVTAIGASAGVYLPPAPGAAGPWVWWATAKVLTPNGFVVGEGATVAAWATIAHEDGGGEMYAWTLPVMVRPHSERPALPTLHAPTP
jgi:hypothetical protein